MFGTTTAGFLIHGLRARIFGQIFDQGFWPGCFEQKIQCTVLPGRKNTVLQYYRDGNHLGENHVIKNPILLKIPYIKNLAVQAVFMGERGVIGTLPLL